MQNRFVWTVAVSVVLATGLAHAAIVDDDTVIYLDGATFANQGESRWTVTSRKFGTKTTDLVSASVMGSQKDAPSDNTSCYYQGSGGYIQLTDSGDAATSYALGDFTVEFFFRSGSTALYSGSYDTYLAWHENAWMMQFGANGTFTLKDWKWGTGGSGTLTGPAICDNLWHHIAFVQVRAANRWLLYVDYKCVGYLNFVVPTTQVPGLLDFNTYAVKHELPHADSNFDEVRITKRALKPSEFLTTPERAATFVDPFALVGTDTIVYVPGAIPPAANQEMNLLRLYDGTKPELKLTYSTAPSQVVAEGLADLYLAPTDGAEKVANAQAYQFKGKGRMIMTDLAYLQNDFTMEFFFRADDPSKVAGDNDDVYLVHQPGSYYFRMAGGTSASAGCVAVHPLVNDFNTRQNLADGNWHHYAMTWEKSTLTMRAYVDHVLYAQQTAAADIWPVSAEPGSDNHALYIGAGSWGTGAWHIIGQGWYDEIRLTGRKLDPSEFLAQRTYPMYANTVAHLNFDVETRTDPFNFRSFGGTMRFEHNQNITANITGGRFEAQTAVVPGPTFYANAAAADASANTRAIYLDITANANGNNTSTGGGYILADPDNLVGSGSFTAEMFFRADTIPTPFYGYLLKQKDIWNVFISNGGKLGVSLGVTEKTVVGKELVTDDAWHHLAVAYDRAAKTFSVYLDYRLFARYENIDDLRPAGKSYPGNLCVGGSDRQGNETSWWALSGVCNRLWYDEFRLTTSPLKVTEFLTLAQLPTASERLWGRFEGASFDSGTPAGQYALTAEASGDVVLKLGPQARPSRRIYANASAAATENAYGAYLNGGTLTYRGEGVLDLPTATTEFFVRGTGTGAAAVAALTAGAEGWTLTADGRLTVAAGDADDSIALNVSPFDGRWHHVAVVTEVGVGETAVRVYVDHALAGSTTLAGQFSFGAPASLVFGSAAFVGGVDEVRVTKAALSTVQLMKCDPPPGILVIVK